MKIVVKIGGTLVEDSALRTRIVESVARVFRKDLQIVLVHGGGKLLSRYLEQAGIESRFVDGLRVTSEEAMDGVVKVFAGTVNHQLLAAFHRAGVPAVGISGLDAGCLVAEKLVGKNGQDWGLVGNIVRANPRVWEVLLSAGILPVMACLAVGDDGQIYNINADQAAVATAVGFGADALLFLTDVDGVLDAEGRLIPRLDTAEISSLIRSGAVTGGMLAKLNAIADALAQGIGHVHIANGRRDGALENGILLCAAQRGAKPSVAGGAIQGTTVFASHEVSSGR